MTTWELISGITKDFIKTPFFFGIVFFLLFSAFCLGPKVLAVLVYMAIHICVSGSWVFMITRAERLTDAKNNAQKISDLASLESLANSSEL